MTTDRDRPPPITGRRRPVPLAFWLHSVIGLKLSLLMGFVCLTGTIATVSHEIEWLYKPKVRASAFAGEPRWGAMWDAARAAFPGTRLNGIGSFDRDDARYFARQVTATDAKGDLFAIYVAPGTARVTGHESGRSFQDFMRALHYYLLVPHPITLYLVTALGFVLMLSIVTGLIVYKQFWRGFFRMPRWGRDPRTWIGDLHRLVGLWSTWFATIIALTSIWYFVQRAGVDVQRAPPAASALGARAVTGAMIDRWAAQARAQMPGMAITAVYLPFGPGQPVIVQGQWRAWLVRERANAVYIDPADGRVIGRQDAHAMLLGERVAHSADPLHFGTFGGLTTKLIWVLFGLSLTGLSASGAYIYARRTRQAVKAGVNLSVLNYLGRAKWPSVAVVMALPVIGFLFG